MNKRYIVLAISGIVLIRFLGIWHDYPFSFYPDESHFVKRALSFGSFDFNPHWFHKPAFYMYILFVEYGGLFVLGKVAGMWSSASDFAVYYIINPGPFYIVGRVTTALFGIATLYLVYVTGERFFRKNSGVIGAILVALSYGHIRASQDVKADIPAAFFAVLSTFFLLLYHKNRGSRDVVLAAIFAGAGAATKVYPIIMMPAVLLSILFCCPRGVVKDVLKAVSLGVTCIAVFWGAYFICSPYSFLDPLGRDAVFHDFGVLFQKVSGLFGGAVGPEPTVFKEPKASLGQGAISYITTLFDFRGMGVPIAAAGISGVFYMLFHVDRKTILFLLFPALLTLFSIYTAPGYAEPRHQVPLYPFLGVAGGVLVSRLSESVNLGKRAVYGTLSVALCWPLYNVLERGFFISKTDTRNIAKIWIEENIPDGTKILINENGPQLLTGEKRILAGLEKAKKADRRGQFTAHYGKYLEYQLEAAKKSVTYDISEIRHPWWRETETVQGVGELTTDYDKDMANPLRPVGVNPYQFYVDNDYRYAIVHSKEYGRYMRPGSLKAKKFPSFFKFYTELFAKGNLVKEFSPRNGNRPGPVVKVFKF
ncbi:MAG: glycosyltransferase family 39 protein [Nitrospinota bacterium]